MSLTYTPQIQYTDANSQVYAFAIATFYLTGTSTPATIYEDSDLSVTMTNPVVADDKGLFPAVYLDENSEYRLKITNADVSVTIIDVDPVNALVSIGAAQIQDGAIEAKLGYTPVNPDAAVFTTIARFTPSVPIAQLHTDDIGYMGAPEDVIDADHTLTLDDTGKLFVHDDTSDYNLTLPLFADVAWPIGHKFYLSVQNTGNTTIVRDSGVTLRISGSGSDADVEFGQYTLVEVRKVNTDDWVAQGQVSASLVELNASRSIAISDADATLVHNDGSNYSYTLDPHSTTAYPNGFEFTVVNTGAGTTTIARGAGVALRKAGSSTNADIAVAQWGKWTIQHISSDEWIAVGAG